MNSPARIIEGKLSDDGIPKRIHAHSLDLLENCGVRFHSQIARELLRSAGAKISGETVRIPAHMVESALMQAPDSFTLHSRDGNHDLVLDGRRTYYSQDGCAAHTLDFETGIRRQSIKADIEKMALVSDALEAVDIITTTVSASDVPVTGRPIQELEACFINTGKPIVTESVANARDARGQIELAAAIAGSEDALRRRPIFFSLICPISPLTQDAGGTEAGLEFVAAGIPLAIYPMATAGVTSPVTLAANTAVANAEVLSLLTLLQLAVPGAKVLYGGGPATIDLRTGSYTATSPEAILLRTMIARMAAFYRLPSMVGAGATSAKRPGAQAAWENTLSFLPASLAGADVLFGVGLLDGSNLLTFEQIVLDSEIATMIRRMLNPVDFEDKSFAAGLIKELGPGGVYLDQMHTVEHMREAISLPLISDRDSYASWHEKGRIDAVSAARAKVKEILAGHRPPPISDDVRQAMKDRVAAYSG